MSTAAWEIRLIQIGRRELGLDEDTYRALLRNLTGKDSSKALSADQRQAVLSHMKQRGFVVRPRAKPAADEQGWQRAPQMRKLRAMWYVLADAGQVERPADMVACNAAIEAWAKTQLQVTAFAAMRFATGVQMDKLIEQMKKWLGRLGLPNE